MKLYPISVSRLTYLDSGQFIVRFLTDYQALNLNSEEDAEFKSLFEDLHQQSPLFNDALKQIRTKVESEELLILDGIRDKKIGALRRALSVFEHTDDDAEISAYTTIKIVLNNYKDIQHANYEAESLAIDRMLSDLNQSNRQQAMQTLGLDVHANKLGISNDNFKEKFNSRSFQNTTETVYDTKMLRTEILNTYKDLTEYVLVMAKRKNTAFYIQTLNAINNGREYFAHMLSRQKSTKTQTETKTD